VIEKLDHAASLERCAQITLVLVQDLKSSTDIVAALTASKVVPAAATSDASSNSNLPSLRKPLQDDTERAQFLMKLAPRIRRLESDTVIALAYRMEETLKRLQDCRKAESELGDDDDEDIVPTTFTPEKDLLLMVGHCMRGLAFLGRGKEVENIFARVAIMYVG
jgi:hypothetical protein